MAEKLLLLVCEGETDVYVFEALVKHFSTTNINLKVVSLAPQQCATSGTYPSFGFGNVLNWCAAYQAKLQMLIDFRGASALFVQMDTDIAQEVNHAGFSQGLGARYCCHERLNQQFRTTDEPQRCHYILPTQNTETWLLACHDNFSALDASCKAIVDYELITTTEKLLIGLGYPSTKRKNRTERKLNKHPATKYIKYGGALVKNLELARPRCVELDKFCSLLEGYAQ